MISEDPEYILSQNLPFPGSVSISLVVFHMVWFEVPFNTLVWSTNLLFYLQPVQVLVPELSAQSWGGFRELGMSQGLPSCLDPALLSLCSVGTFLQAHHASITIWLNWPLDSMNTLNLFMCPILNCLSSLLQSLSSRPPPIPKLWQLGCWETLQVFSPFRYMIIAQQPSP